MWGYHDGMGWWMLFGGLSMAIFWALALGLAVWAVNRFSGQSNGEHQERGESALEIARRRLARGEITRQQWDEVKKELQ